MTDFRPEAEFKETPKEFSEESRITSIRTKDYHRGIVLDTPEEFGTALIVYDGGQVPGARATQDDQLNNVSRDFGTLGVGITLLSGLQNAQGFTEKLAKEAIAELQSTGRFRRSFDYDASGTNFFKTTVNGKKVGEHYVLELNAAYVGTQPENALAETLRKPMAMTQAAVLAQFNPVDTYWFNANLESMLKDLPITKKQVAQLAKYLGKEDDFMSEPEIIFKHDGQKLQLHVNLDNVTTYLHPEGGDIQYNYIERRGNHVVGPAWTNYAEDGNTPELGRIRNPALELSVSFPGRYSAPPAVIEKEMLLLQNARESIARKVAPKE